MEKDVHTLTECTHPDPLSRTHFISNIFHPIYQICADKPLKKNAPVNFSGQEGTGWATIYELPESRLGSVEGINKSEVAILSSLKAKLQMTCIIRKSMRSCYLANSSYEVSDLDQKCGMCRWGFNPLPPPQSSILCCCMTNIATYMLFLINRPPVID